MRVGVGLTLSRAASGRVVVSGRYSNGSIDPAKQITIWLGAESCGRKGDTFEASLVEGQLFWTNVVGYKWSLILHRVGKYEV